MATALATLMSLPAVALAPAASPAYRLERLERALGPGSPRLFVKRDDLLPFGGGGNKVRKLELLAADAARQGADTLITAGAVQSNHARVTAAAGAVLGHRVVLILSGRQPETPTGNLARDLLFGAEVQVVATREAREAAMSQVADDVRRAGGRPYVIPVGGSTALGAAGMARGPVELSRAGLRPDVIVHASSSAGTQAGLIAGCALIGLETRVVGISADEPAAALEAHVSNLLDGLSGLLGARPDTVRGVHPVAVDDGQVGGGYGRPTDAGRSATELLARTEGILLDQVYTAKAFAGLLASVRAGAFQPDHQVLFWHTGGLSE